MQGNPCSLNPVERKKIMKIKTKTHNYRAIPVQWTVLVPSFQCFYYRIFPALVTTFPCFGYIFSLLDLRGFLFFLKFQTYRDFPVLATIFLCFKYRIFPALTTSFFCFGYIIFLFYEHFSLFYWQGFPCFSKILCCCFSKSREIPVIRT